jgi:hypothetical protein
VRFVTRTVRTRRRIALCAVALSTGYLGMGCCIPIIESRHEVDVDDLVLAATTTPEQFDARIGMLGVDEDDPRCLRQLAADVYDEENAKLRECAALLTGSPLWEECHEEAAGLHNRRVLLEDVAGAVEGGARFDRSRSGLLLIDAKQLLGAAAYEAYVAELNELLPAQTCDFGCD